MMLLDFHFFIIKTVLETATKHFTSSIILTSAHEDYY